MPNFHSDISHAVQALTVRQRSMLRMVVQQFIESAGPVGSTALRTRFQLKHSPATIRNTMNELEQLGFLSHPHTSAGRVPTDLGYHAFVSELMDTVVLDPGERRIIQQELASRLDDSQALIKESSRLLAKLAQLLGVVLGPKIQHGVLQRLDIVPVSSGKILFVISVEGGFIRTILMSTGTELDPDHLGRLVSLLNERLAGLTLEEIRRTCVPRIRDLAEQDNGVIELMLHRSADLFSDDDGSRTVQMDGASFMLRQPEFAGTEPVRDLIQLLDDESTVIRMLEHDDSVVPGKARVRIGFKPSEGEEGRPISIVTAPYLLSNLQGTIGLIGPTRMNYARAVALVEGMATLMSLSHSRNNLA